MVRLPGENRSFNHQRPLLDGIHGQAIGRWRATELQSIARELIAPRVTFRRAVGRGDGDRGKQIAAVRTT
jgi:hypothetical protein